MGRSQNFNWSSIIDWGFSAKVPFQQAASFPRFLRLQHLAPSFVLQKDRETYIASLRSQMSQTVTWMILVLSSENADFHVCFLESIISKGMHQWLARNRWRLPSCGKFSNGGGDGRSENDRRLSCSGQEYIVIFCIIGMMMVLALFLRR